MKAFAITARDSQPTIQDLPNPEPATGEVLVEVEAASVNGFDLSVAAGYVWGMIQHEFPVVLGRNRPVRRALPEVQRDLEWQRRRKHLLPERTALRSADPGRL